MSQLKNVHTFPFNKKSEVTDETYEGQFTCRRMTVKDRTRINVRKAQLSGGMYCVRDENGMPTGMGIDEETEGTNYMLAYLEVLLVSKPDWFKADEVFDLDVMFAVYREVEKFNDSFRVVRGDAAAPNGGSPPSGAGTGAAQPAAPNNGNPAPKVVGKEVSPSMDA